LRGPSTRAMSINKYKYMKYLKYILIITILIPVFALSANVGVSIDTSEIRMDDVLKPGGVYVLSHLEVTNTGDEEKNYVMSLVYNEEQEELVPPVDWIEFFPQEFTLDPGEVKIVRVELSLPFNAEAGDYLSYLEARVLRESGVGIAAATRLLFSVGEGNFLQAFASRSLALVDYYKPWTHIVMWVVVASVPIAMVKRNFEFKINLKSAKKRAGGKSFELIPKN